MLNLFAFRATDPAVMRAAADPVGPSDDAVLETVTADATRVLCAWGVHGVHRNRARRVLQLLGDRPLVALGVTIDGQPTHPLYLRSEIEPITYPPTSERLKP
jgi:hypothetical protein